jgi:hypothetical protein
VNPGDIQSEIDKFKSLNNGRMPTPKDLTDRLNAQ